MPPPLVMCVWNIVLETDAPIPPGTPVRGIDFHSDGYPDEPLPVSAKPNPTNGNLVQIRFPSSALSDGQRTGGGMLEMQGYKPIPYRCDIPKVGFTDAVPVNVPGQPPHHPGFDPYPLPKLEPATVPFVFPTAEKLEPWEKEPDPYGFGTVYDTLTPEYLALPGASPIAPDLDLIRGDVFSFVMAQAPQAINPAADFAFLQSIEDNTEYGMLMRYLPLLVRHYRDVQDAIISDYRERNTHIALGVYDRPLDDLVDLCRRCKAAGLFVFLQEKTDTAAVDYLIAANAIDGVLCGFEMNKLRDVDADAFIRYCASVCQPRGLRVWVHFLSQGGPHHTANWGFFDFTDWWRQMAAIGVTGGMYQTWMTYNPDTSYAPEDGADPNQFGDCAGKMGAMMVYMRRGLFQADPRLKFCVAEVWSAPLLYGHTDKAFARRRAGELICCPSDGSMATICGSLDGAIGKDGSVV